MKNNQPPVYVGMDVAKATLQVHLLGRQTEFANNSAGLAKLCKKLRTVPAAHVVCEATGGYERAATKAFHEAKIPVSVVNPAQVRASAQAQGQRAKNDLIDGALLTDYGQRFHPAPTPQPAPGQEELAALTGWLRQLIQARATAKTQAEHHTAPFILAQHAELLTHFAIQIKAVERQIKSLVQQDPVLTSRVECLENIVGIGPRSAWLILAVMPELGELNRGAAASLAGLAPWAKDSGESRGVRRISGGRSEIRHALYMPALSASRANPVLKAYYQHLIGRHKPAKVVLTAVMRKLLLHMNSELKKLAAQPPPEKKEKLKKSPCQ
jgi:transposase